MTRERLEGYRSCREKYRNCNINWTTWEKVTA